MRTFQGSSDKSVIVLEGVFPGSNLIFSTPLEFSGKRSGVYLEGEYGEVEKAFPFLTQLVGVAIDERMFGRWIAATPPFDDDPVKTILHYEAIGDFEKIQLLSLVLRNHLAKICNLCVSVISSIRINFEGVAVFEGPVVLPRGFVNGEIILSPEANEEDGINAGRKNIVFQ
jgi:hypothetical protein